MSHNIYQRTLLLKAEDLVETKNLNRVRIVIHFDHKLGPDSMLCTQILTLTKAPKFIRNVKIVRMALSSLSSPATADLCDYHIKSPQRLQIVEPNLFKSFGKKKAFHGEIETVSCFESNPLVRETLSSEGRGRVLVVDGGGSKRCAILGDMLAGFAKDNNWAGVVVNGYIRDSAVINEMEDVGIKALGTHPLKSAKTHPGSKGVSVNFGGVEFVPGHYLYSDEDGIIISETHLMK